MSEEEKDYYRILADKWADKDQMPLMRFRMYFCTDCGEQRKIAQSQPEDVLATVITGQTGFDRETAEAFARHAKETGHLTFSEKTFYLVVTPEMVNEAVEQTKAAKAESNE